MTVSALPEPAISATASVFVLAAPITIPQSVGTGCPWIEPLRVRTLCGTFTALAGGQESVLYMTATSGNADMRNARMTIHYNPVALDCASESQDSWDQWVCLPPNVELRIPYLPKNSVLTLDGRLQAMSLTCGKSVVPGEPYIFGDDLGTGFCWPALTCFSACVCWAWDTDNTGTGASVDVQFIPRVRI